MNKNNNEIMLYSINEINDVMQAASNNFEKICQPLLTKHDVENINNFKNHLLETLKDCVKVDSFLANSNFYQDGKLSLKNLEPIKYLSKNGINRILNTINDDNPVKQAYFNALNNAVNANFDLQPSEKIMKYNSDDKEVMLYSINKLNDVMQRTLIDFEKSHHHLLVEYDVWEINKLKKRLPNILKSLTEIDPFLASSKFYQKENISFKELKPVNYLSKRGIERVIEQINDGDNITQSYCVDFINAIHANFDVQLSDKNCNINLI